jgi:hypothetical protein
MDAFEIAHRKKFKASKQDPTRKKGKVNPIANLQVLK